LTDACLAIFMSSFLCVWLIYYFGSAAIPVGDSTARHSNPFTGNTESQTQFSAPAFHVDKAGRSTRRPSSPVVGNDAVLPGMLERPMESHVQLHDRTMRDGRDLFASGLLGSIPMADAGHESAHSLHTSSWSDSELMDGSGVRDSTTDLGRSR
jgi:hypothetical protein